MHERALSEGLHEIEMFERTVDIDADKCDGGRLSILSLFRHLSEIMAENAESYGAGKAYHDAKNRLWVLLEYDIDIERLPAKGERVRLGTLPYAFWKVYGYRVYRIRSLDGEHLVSGKGKFTLIDTRKRAIVRPDADMLALFVDAHPEPLKLDFPDAPRHAGAALFKTCETIRKRHLDVNDHVNNAEYVGLAEQAVKQHFKTPVNARKVGVWYRRETKLRETLTIRGFKVEDGCLVEMHKGEALHARVWFAGFFMPHKHIP